ncbi:uncharacterized protein DMAD_02336 [Drosophila madeirensis]|uniref:Uncharacterized protein n=1 Tax=Drosophila madeirensis TaxID=30013 RepID=A0AAU9G5Y0_DROMD
MSAEARTGEREKDWDWDWGWGAGKSRMPPKTILVSELTWQQDSGQDMNSQMKGPKGKTTHRATKVQQHNGAMG